MTTAAELTTMLATTRTAIDNILTGAQSGDHGDRSWRFAELEQLQSRERYLESKLGVTNRGPIAGRQFP